MGNEGKFTCIIAGGGTSGHVNPALAVAAALKEQCPQAKLLFLATAQGIEQRILAQSSYDYELIQAAALPPKHPYLNLAFMGKAGAGTLKCLALIMKYKPDVVFGTGGYVGAPLLLAARILGVPYVIHEQNAFPGKANRRFAKAAHKVCLSFPTGQELFQSEQIVLTGNPVRREFFTADPQSCRQALGVDPNSFLIVVMGGSLGAARLNEAVLGLDKEVKWQELLAQRPNLRLVLSSGYVNSQSLPTVPASWLTVTPYLDSSLWLPAADLLLGRAGASFVMEAAACGKPAVLIPFPEAQDDHQSYNAQSFAAAGAAQIMADATVNSSSLAEIIGQLLQQDELRATMGQQARKLASEDAAQLIAQQLLALQKR